MASAAETVNGPNDGSEIRALERDPKRVAVTELRFIDIEPFLRPSTLEERTKVARAIRAACIDIGFFYLTGHGFSQEELDNLLAEGRRFFELPLDEKMKLARMSETEFGYRHSGAVEADDGSTPDVKERFFASRELFPGEPRFSGFAPGNSRWPSQDVLPNFANTVKAYNSHQTALAQALARAFALSLDLPEDYFDEAFAFPEGSIGLNYYPPIDAAKLKPNQWSFAPHSDYGAFTILLQDESGGLQASNTSGEWIDVPPQKGTMVVNLGDLFPRWTNDLYVSTLHRGVHVGADKARISAAFFVSPRRGTMVECLETCQGPGNPPRYAPVESEDYANQLRLSAYHAGTPGIAPETAERLKS